MFNTKLQIDYYTKEEVDKFNSDGRDYMQEQLTNYQTIESFIVYEQKNNDALERIKEDLNEMYQYAKRIETELKGVQNILPKKAEQLEVRRVWKNFENYCSYQELKDLYNKVMPTLQRYDAKMMDMSRDYERSKEIIRRYDEVLLEKANKLAVKELEEYV